MGQRDIPGADLTTTVYTTVHVYDVAGEVEVRSINNGAPFIHYGEKAIVFLEDWEELALLRDKIDEALGEQVSDG